MSRWYKYACAALAIAILPGSIPVTVGYAAFRGYQAVRRRFQRRRLKRIIVAVGNGRQPWREHTDGFEA